MTDDFKEMVHHEVRLIAKRLLHPINCKSLESVQITFLSGLKINNQYLVAKATLEITGHDHFVSKSPSQSHFSMSSMSHMSQ